MDDKKIKLKDLLKGSGWEEIPKEMQPEERKGVTKPDGDITTELSDILKTWETKEYESDESKWKEYYKDIDKVLKKYK